MFSVLVVFVGVLLVLIWQIIKPNPALAILDVFEFSDNLLFAMACLLNSLPKIQKLNNCNCAVLVHVDCIEKLLSRNLAKLSFPMFDCLVPIDFI